MMALDQKALEAAKAAARRSLRLNFEVPNSEADDVAIAAIEGYLSALPAGTVEPVAWRGLGTDGVDDVTLRQDIAAQWAADGIEVSPLYSADAIAQLTRERDEAINRAEVAEYKLGQSVNVIQPMIIARAEAAETSNARLRGALKKIAEHPQSKELEKDKWGEFKSGNAYGVGWAFYNVQNIARTALEAANGK